MRGLRVKLYVNSFEILYIYIYIYIYINLFEHLKYRESCYKYLLQLQQHLYYNSFKRDYKFGAKISFYHLINLHQSTCYIK